MKREIKFRAWDGKRFVSQNQYGIIGVCVESGDLFMASTGSCESPVNWMNNCKLMQFTGLHDENGKEIYEGDILNTLHGTLSVEFNDDTCKFQFSNGMDINDREMYGMSKIIIGNIYENQNLT
jgi:uncharacterized phage protein (TIGR01671 family)